MKINPHFAPKWSNLAKSDYAASMSAAVVVNLFRARSATN